MKILTCWFCYVCTQKWIMRTSLSSWRQNKRQQSFAYGISRKQRKSLVWKNVVCCLLFMPFLDVTQRREYWEDFCTEKVKEQAFCGASEYVSKQRGHGQRKKAAERDFTSGAIQWQRRRATRYPQISMIL